MDELEDRLRAVLQQRATRAPLPSPLGDTLRRRVARRRRARGGTVLGGATVLLLLAAGLGLRAPLTTDTALTAGVPTAPATASTTSAPAVPPSCGTGAAPSWMADYVRREVAG